MSNSHRKGRKAYLNDYKPKKGGGYEYKGKRYAYRGDQSFKSMLIRLWAFGGGAFACMIVAGSVSPPGINGCAYVILPYAAGVIAAVSIVWALCRLTARGQSLEKHVYEATVEALPKRGIMFLFFSAISLAGLAVYVIFNGFQQKFIHFLVFFAAQILGMVLIILLGRYIKSIEWHETPSQN